MVQRHRVARRLGVAPSAVYLEQVPRPMTNPRTGVILAAISAFLAAAFFVPYKQATAYAPNDVIVLALLLPAAVFNTITLAVDRRQRLRIDLVTVGVAAALGVGTVLGNICATEALSRLSAGITSLILQTQILFVSLASWMVLSERITVRFIIGMLIAGGGFAIVQLAGGGSAAASGAGALWALGAALSFGMMHVVTRRYIHRIQPVTVNAVRLWMAVALLAVLPGRAAGLTNLSGEGWLLAATAAMFGPTLARTTIMYAVRHIPASYSTLITLITPVFAFVLELVFLGTHPTLMELLGGTVILAGVAIPVLELAATTPTTDL